MKISPSKVIQFLLTAVLWISFADSTAQTLKQNIDKQFQVAVLDSAIKFEALKPRFYSLKTSYEHLQKQNIALENAARISSYSNQKLTSKFEATLKNEQKKRRRRLLLGFVLGALTGSLIH